VLERGDKCRKGEVREILKVLKMPLARISITRGMNLRSEENTEKPSYA